MRVLKEKVLGTRGDWVVKGRVVVFNTKTTGEVRRAELTLEKIVAPGTPENPIGWSLKDIEQLHQLLGAYIKENNETPQ
jgi:hypothetical protein